MSLIWLIFLVSNFSYFVRFGERFLKKRNGLIISLLIRSTWCVLPHTRSTYNLDPGLKVPHDDPSILTLFSWHQDRTLAYSTPISEPSSHPVRTSSGSI